jgi:hypothetical protein
MRLARSVKAWSVAGALLGMPAINDMAGNAAMRVVERDRLQAILRSDGREQSAELYRAVLDRFPDFGPAKQNLAKVQNSGD